MNINPTRNFLLLSFFALTFCIFGSSVRAQDVADTDVDEVGVHVITGDGSDTPFASLSPTVPPTSTATETATASATGTKGASTTHPAVSSLPDTGSQPAGSGNQTLVLSLAAAASFLLMGGLLCARRQA